MKAKIKATLHDEKEYGKLTKCGIVAEYSSVADYPVYLVYSTMETNEEGDKMEHLIVKEFTRRSTCLDEGEIFHLRQSLVSEVFELKFQVFQYKKSICVEVLDEIIIINKQH